MPLCQSECEKWFTACINDFTCTRDWKTSHANSHFTCTAKDKCQTFRDKFQSAEHFCNTVRNIMFFLISAYYLPFIMIEELGQCMCNPSEKRRVKFKPSLDQILIRERLRLGTNKRPTFLGAYNKNHTSSNVYPLKKFWFFSAELGQLAATVILNSSSTFEKRGRRSPREKLFWFYARILRYFILGVDENGPEW